MKLNNQDDSYVPALRYRWLTGLYDPVVAITTREKVFRNKMLDLVTDKGAGRVLDLACGTGTLAQIIKKKYPDKCVTGLDGDPTILKIARQKTRQNNLDIHFDEALSFSMPYPDDSFDLVVSSLFFHHLTANKKHRTLAEIHRVLAPDGKLVICDWGKPANPLLRLSFYLVQLLDGFEVTADNVRGRLAKFITTAGFRKVMVKERISTMLGTLDLIIASKN